MAAAITESLGAQDLLLDQQPVAVERLRVVRIDPDLGTGTGKEGHGGGVIVQLEVRGVYSLLTTYYVP